MYSFYINKKIIERLIFMNILVPVDGSKTSKKALEKAIKIAQQNHGKIYILNAIERIALNVQAVVDFDMAKKQSKKLLKEYEDLVKGNNIDCKTILEFGVAKKIIISNSYKYNADLIIIGRRGLNKLERLVVGSTSSYVISHANMDVLVVSENNQFQIGPNQPQEQPI